MGEARIRLLLIDDHLSFRMPMGMLLNIEPDMMVVAEAGSMAEARNAIAEHSDVIDIALVDLDLPDGSGVDLIATMHERDPRIESLVLTASSGLAEQARAIEAGASGVLNKSASYHEVLDAIRTIHGGGSILSSRETMDLLRAASRLRAAENGTPQYRVRLTEREREVLQLLSEGLSDKDIALRLHISNKTARAHVMNILTKLEVESRLQAVIIAVRQGLVKID